MRKADNLPPYRAVVMKSVSLNFLDPSGPAQACYGRTLPFFFNYVIEEFSEHGMSCCSEIISLNNICNVSVPSICYVLRGFAFCSPHIVGSSSDCLWVYHVAVNCSKTEEGSLVGPLLRQ